MFLRIVSAIVGLGILWTIWFFADLKGLVVFSAAVTFLMCLEYSTMVEKKSRLIQSFFVLLAFSFYLSFTFISQSFLSFMVCFLALTSYFVLFTNYTVEERMIKLSAWLTGIIYCGALSGAVTLGLLKFGITYFIALILVSFNTDTFAYFGGRFWGRHKLSPQISPNKTLEGSAAGLIGGSSAGFTYLYLTGAHEAGIVLFIACFLASMFSQIGDLFESLLKRQSGVKDSGKLMPGHGGVLDRIDGVLFAAPVLYLCMLFFQR